MENEFEHWEALIAKFLAGETSPEEAARLESWRRESAVNEQIFRGSSMLMNTLDANVNTDAAWNKLNKLISGAPPKILPIYQRPAVLRVAAALILVAAFGFIVAWFMNQSTAKPLVLMAAKQTRQEKLPDGSTVFINKGSELSYEAAKDGSRQVKLKGEAFFEVVHNEKEPFVVLIDDIRIQDIGTAFNIKAVPGSGSIEVTVESGEVHFYSAVDQGLKLRQGEKALYEIASKRFTKTTPVPSENITSYKTKLFRFRDTPLREVVAQINSVYDTNIRLADEATGNELLSVVFDNQKPEFIVDMIAETLDLEVEKTGAGVVVLRRRAVAY
jgi:transmembrane sensor